MDDRLEPKNSFYNVIQYHIAEILWCLQRHERITITHTDCWIKSNIHISNRSEARISLPAHSSAKTLNWFITFSCRLDYIYFLGCNEIHNQQQKGQSEQTIIWRGAAKTSGVSHHQELQEGQVDGRRWKKQSQETDNHFKGISSTKSPSESRYPVIMILDEYSGPEVLDLDLQSSSWEW